MTYISALNENKSGNISAHSRDDVLLGNILIELGYLKHERLQAALAERSVTKDRLSTILIRNGFVRQKELVSVLREISPSDLLAESIILPEIPPKILIDTKTMIIADLPDTVFIATLSKQALVKKVISGYLGGRTITFVPVSPQRLELYIDTLTQSNQSDIGIMDRLVRDAIYAGASDIHIIPRMHSYTVKLRILGVLTLAHEGKLDEYLTLSSRIKDKSGMDMAERRRPQDGSISVEYNGRVIDLRIATIPSVDGERIVVRILDPDSVNPRLDSLGISRLDQWNKAVSRPDGLCLICGPTGSGKSTTLNATLREMNFLERSIYTVEDPVEYRLAYAGQVNANSATGLDFSSSIRAFLRADPDVIVVGEVRDIDTARNAIKASETGHLVVATLHAQSIRGALSRLRDIGVPANDLRYQLRGILVQRLVRSLCTKCGGCESGCATCNFTRYEDRTIVSEAIYLPDEEAVDRLISGEIFWGTMLDDAKRKMDLGITDFKELSRVFGAQIEDTCISETPEEEE